MSLGLARNTSLACSVYKWGIQILDLVWRLAWVILGMVVVALMLLGLYKLTVARRARIKKKDEEVFQLVRQATNFLYQQHQLASREGKGGPTYLAINHIRDQLIPPQDRQAKAGVWGEVVEYIEKNESRVRQDVQKIFGEDFRVWQWLPESHWSPSSSPPSPEYLLHILPHPALVLLYVLHHLPPHPSLGLPVLGGDQLVSDVVDGQVGGTPLTFPGGQLMLLVQEVGCLPHQLEHLLV